MKVNTYYYLHAAVCIFKLLKAVCLDKFPSFSHAALQNCSHVAPAASCFTTFCAMIFASCGRAREQASPHTSHAAGSLHADASMDRIKILDAGGAEALKEFCDSGEKTFSRLGGLSIKIHASPG